MNQNDCIGKTLKPWPNLVDHYNPSTSGLSAEVNYSKATDDIYANGEGKAQDDKTQILFGTRFYF